MNIYLCSVISVLPWLIPVDARKLLVVDDMEWRVIVCLAEKCSEATCQMMADVSESYKVWTSYEATWADIRKQWTCN